MRQLIFLIPFLLFSTAEAEVPAVTLKSRYNNSINRINFSSVGPSAITGCRLDIYGSKFKAKLEANPSSGTPVLALLAGTDKNTVKAADLPALKGRKKLFFRATIDCNGDLGTTNVSRIVVKPNRSGLSAKEWFQALRAALLKSTISIKKVFINLSFSKPVDFQSPDDGTNRIFIVEQAGTIRVFSNNAAVSSSHKFLDLSDKTNADDEQGLLGLAFHPNYSTNGFFFVNYTRAEDGATVIARYKASDDDADSADVSSELVILTVDQPFANHNGGALAFGKDGYLYIALGDGGSGGDPLGNGQSKTTLLGKILRLDIDGTSTFGNYRIPDDNPFAGNNSGFKEEIFAYGLRNPWRISFDSRTGVLWAADVGQDELEEVDIITNGGNYGWNTLEGSRCYAEENCSNFGFEAPVTEYSHDVGSSITGGYVYRGSKVPNLEGYYTYADFITGRIFALERNAGKTYVTELNDSSLNISSFGQDQAGEVYLLSYADGELYRFNQ